MQMALEYLIAPGVGEVRKLQSPTLEQWNYRYHHETHRKILSSKHQRKKLLYKCLHSFQKFFCICVYLCIYYKIARIKLLVYVASVIGARVKAVSVKKINYLYTCGIEASSNL